MQASASCASTTFPLRKSRSDLIRIFALFTVAVLACAGADRGALRAGVAHVDITPEGPIWLSGYANRTHASTGVASRLGAKALAIEDAKGARIVIVTTDIIGLPRAITDAVSARLMKEHGLERSHIVFNSSHTHTGPVVKSNLMTMFDLNAEETARVDAYARDLTEKLFSVAAAAIGDLAPAQLSYGAGEAGFAMNRRRPSPQGIKLSDNPNGPVDHSVPVIRVTTPDGKLKAVLFAYACHNTTLTGDFYDVSADYAGFAQAAIEAAHPGATAMFLMLCGGDQNPSPRSTIAISQQHGNELAASVERVLGGKLEPISGPLRTSFESTELGFAMHTRETFEADLSNKNPSVVRRAKSMLKAYDEGHPVRQTPYPVQAIRFGNGGPVLLALGGEVVVDYDLRAKSEYPKTKLIVAGYSNDVMGYIPSKRVLGEGGYEAVDSMVYYGMPGPFADDVEERVFSAIHRVMSRVGIK
jgi:neutral ceramidase